MCGKRFWKLSLSEARRLSGIRNNSIVQSIRNYCISCYPMAMSQRPSQDILWVPCKTMFLCSIANRLLSFQTIVHVSLHDWHEETRLLWDWGKFLYFWLAWQDQEYVVFFFNAWIVYGYGKITTGTLEYFYTLSKTSLSNNIQYPVTVWACTNPLLQGPALAKLP